MREEEQKTIDIEAASGCATLPHIHIPTEYILVSGCSRRDAVVSTSSLYNKVLVFLDAHTVTVFPY